MDSLGHLEGMGSRWQRDCQERSRFESLKWRNVWSCIKVSLPTALCNFMDGFVLDHFIYSAMISVNYAAWTIDRWIKLQETFNFISAHRFLKEKEKNILTQSSALLNEIFWHHTAQQVTSRRDCFSLSTFRWEGTLLSHRIGSSLSLHHFRKLQSSSQFHRWR